MSERARVLIVDDEELILRSLSRLLVRAGYDVVSSSSLVAAKTALAAEAFDVVLTDLRVGSASGLGIVEVARTLESPPRVLVLSGAVSPEDVAGAMKAGATAVLRKPVVPSELVAAVAAAAARR